MIGGAVEIDVMIRSSRLSSHSGYSKDRVSSVASHFADIRACQGVEPFINAAGIGPWRIQVAANNEPLT
jgi:hypothetical protein